MPIRLFYNMFLIPLIMWNMNKKPLELACYSRIEGGDVYFDDHSLRLFRRHVGDYVGADLNEGFKSFVEKKRLRLSGFWQSSCLHKKQKYSTAEYSFFDFP
ncbi:NAD-capped RNA hydrolase DXO1-like isoform X2 [Magnolia sinica]|uniref:NAD-capped RNA hydrolase DXO1-like isoform X2 n=1 Tax=Magnolia sinica TaxID=86752 RepID=UPI002658AED5|nr:NAD-capped RNA hydrolase DXO1-like isoform X2 [Magnolia sinica]